MGENITIGESLLITVFSMLVVFIVLLCISHLIDLLRIATNGKRKDTKNTVAEENKEINENIKEVSTDENLDDEELVAVIAAAIAASMGVGIPDINIKSIIKTSPISPIWSEASRIDQTMNKL